MSTAPGATPGRTTQRSLDQLLAISERGGPDPMRLVELIVAAVPSADHVCLTLVQGRDDLVSVACSDDLGDRLHGAQIDLGVGPAWDAVEQPVDIVHVPDLATAGRWAPFASRAVELGVQSAVSVRMSVPRVGRAALSVYANRTDAFSDLDLELVTLFGSFVGLAVQSTQQRERAANLELALDTNRHIGTAMGILMARELLTADQAFDRLREISQHQHRKLRDIADEVNRTGAAPQID